MKSMINRNDLELLKELHENKGYIFSFNNIATEAIHSDKIEIIKWVVEQVKNVGYEYIIEDITVAAAKENKDEILKWICKNGGEYTTVVERILEMKGKYDMIKWLNTNIGEPKFKIGFRVESRNHIGIFEYLTRFNDYIFK